MTVELDAHESGYFTSAEKTVQGQRARDPSPLEWPIGH
jgi:hypothetical protein